MKRVWTRSATTASKRKRRFPEYNSCNIENMPVQEKRIREDVRITIPSDEESEPTCDERLPLAELSVLHLATSSEVNDFGREYQCSPESLTNSSPSKEDSSSATEIKVTTDGSKLKNKLNHYLDDCEIVLHWPTVIRKLNCENPKNFYFCLRSETQVERNYNLFENHPGLQPRMRAVLLEWILEVSDVFKLHRETFYLAVDYLDRYLFRSRNVPKVKLQLLGISCLLIACKLEEIYPPKVAEMAYVTDGACTEIDILSMEVNIIRMLNWRFKSITPNCWLLIYLQLGYMLVRKEKDLDLLHPLYPPELYSTTSQLLDLITLDATSLNFDYSVLALSSLFVVCSQKFPLHVTGYDFEELEECVCWVEAFWSTIKEKKKCDDPNYQPVLTAPRRLVTDVSHFLLKNSVNLELLEHAQENVERLMHPSPSSLNLLTPPSSSKKMECSEFESD